MAVMRGIARDEPTTEVIQLYESHQAEVRTYLTRLVNDREWARDLTQETFLRAFRARGQLAQIDNRRAWLYRIATNLAFTGLKRQRRFAWLPWSATDSLQNQPDASEQFETRNAVEEALKRLDISYRAPLLLYEHYGLSVAEIAETLGIGESAVKVRLYRAREQFRQVYQGGRLK